MKPKPLIHLKKKPFLYIAPMGKKKTVDSLVELADHFDQIRSTNGNLTEQQVLEIVAKATSQTLSIVKKRWKLIQNVDWPILDYLDRGVIGMNRAITVAEADLELAERTKVMDESLDQNVSDTGFKEFLAKYLESKEEQDS